MFSTSQPLIKELLLRLKREAESPSGTINSKLKFSLLEPKNVAARKSYVGTSYAFLGLTSAQSKAVRKLDLQIDSSFKLKQRLKLWTEVWQKSRHFHIMIHAFQMVDELARQELSSEEHLHVLKTLISWVPHVDNWAHSDCLSGTLAFLLDQALQINDAALIKAHTDARKKMNRSKNFWERRQSIVSLMNYAPSREKFLPFATMRDLVVPLIKDEAFYVQRGVGWTLRELFYAYPKPTSALLLMHVKNLGSIAFVTATEKCPPAFKTRLKKLR